MRPIRYFFIIPVSFLLMFAGAGSVGGDKNAAAKWSFEDIYQVKPFRGKTARLIKFSEDDRYLAFLWNTYEDFGCRLLLTARRYRAAGYDLHIYDIKEGKLKRVTSPERMKRFDPPEDYEKFVKKRKQILEEEQKRQEMILAQRDFLQAKEVDLEKFERQEIEELKKELEEKKKEEKEKKKDKKKEEKELELWELRDKLKEKKKKEAVKIEDLYPGVSGYEWSKPAAQLIFQYRGDLYRYLPETDEIRRLTMTDEAESIISYTPDGSGYYYAKEERVFLVKFDSAYIRQINHQLNEENKYKIAQTRISPDGKWMLILAAKKEAKPANREVQIMDYQKRFAEAQKIKRQVADDKRNEPHYRFILRDIRQTNYGREPEHIFEIPGGDVWYEFSDIEWSKDSSRYAFMTWEREKGDLKIWLGRAAAGEKPELLYEMKEQIGFKGFYENNVKFTPDGKRLAAVLNNEAGFRQPVIFDLETKKKTSVLKGKFESYPILDFSRDSCYMYIVSDKESPAWRTVYRVSLENGGMTRIGKTRGMHRRAAVSHGGEWLAVNFGNWTRMAELYLLNTRTGEEKVLTDSHRKGWENIYFIKPEIFQYKNRDGDTIQGMIFKPAGWRPEAKRPGIVYLYGGPVLNQHTVEVDNFSPLSYLFQMLMAAKHGYVTINIDPRGQTGYGKRFSEANFQDPGNPQTEDLEDLVKHIHTGFGVDSRKLGLHGWSFGGFQTIKTMLSSPETFACGIAVASVTEWENYNSWYAGATIGKSVRDKPNLRKYSLIPQAHKLRRPLLLIHGMMDDNVLYQDTLKMYNAFLGAGKETLVELFLDPEGKHSLGGTVKYKAVYKKFESWFLRHLGTYGSRQSQDPLEPMQPFWPVYRTGCRGNLQ
jgi:dipeptidyl aminopeptidase/acylaminoacyl peptidase